MSVTLDTEICASRLYTRELKLATLLEIEGELTGELEKLHETNKRLAKQLNVRRLAI